MAAKLRIPTAQQLRFVNKSYYNVAVPTFDSMLYPDYFMFSKVKDLTYIPYCQLVEQTDSLWVQFRTSYPDFLLTLVKVDPYTETPYNAFVGAPVYTYVDSQGDTINTYNITVNVAALTGKYYFKIKGYAAGFPELEWPSEQFDVQSEHEETILIEWGGNSTGDDGLRWSTIPYNIDQYQSMRIEGAIYESNYEQGKNTYNDADTELTTLRAYPSATHVFDFKRIPFYLIERLTLALTHDEFKINGVLYNIADEFEATNYKTQLAGAGTIPLKLVEYENYTLDPILTGDIPVFPQAYLLINGIDSVLINATDKVKLNN